MKIYFIRHFQKLYNNNKKQFQRFVQKHGQTDALGNPYFVHDSPLLMNYPDGSTIYDKAQILRQKVMKNGEKTPYVLISPYLRTWQTFQYIAAGDWLCYKISPHISEYLGNQKHTEVSENTAKFHPPNHEETLEDLQKRAEKHVEELYVLKERGVETVWVISHSLTIYTVLRTLFPEVSEEEANAQFKMGEGEFTEVNI